MTEKRFAIRFAVEDMEKVRTALKGMGSDGASALSALERASRGATPGLKAVDSAARDLRQEFDAFAQRIPIIGGALSALGPVGTVAAAGFGAITLGLGALSNASRQAIEDIGRLQDRADALNTTTTALQAIRSEGMLRGLDEGELDSALSTLQLNSARASEGFGRMKQALDRVNPELGRQLGLATSLEERMNILARGIQGATTENEKLNIAAAAFGGSGAAMLRMLDESGASIEDWKEKARSAGLILEEDLVRAVDLAGDRIDRMRARTEVAMQRVAVAMAPFEEWMETAKGNYAQGFAFLASGDVFKSLQDQSTGYLANEYGKARARMQTMIDRGVPENSETLRGYPERIAAMRAELQRRYGQAGGSATANAAQATQEQVKAEAEAFGEWLDNWYVGLQQRQRTAAENAAQDAARDAEEAARKREVQERAAMDVRASLGDWTGKLAQREAELNELVAAGVLSREEAAAATASYRAELDGSAAAAERWRNALEASETPVQRAQRALAAFDDEVERYGDLAGVNEDAVRVSLVAAIDAAERAAREAAPAVDGLNRALENTAEAQRAASFELRFAAETLDSILDENMNSLEDLGSVALRVFRQMAIDWIRENQKMAASQSLWDFIGNAFKAGFGGGGSSAGSNAAQAEASAGAGWGVYHAGTGFVGAGAAPMRSLPASFSGVPRFHNGLAPDEMPSILQRGERVLSVVHNERLVQAVENGGAARVELHFHGEMGGRPEVSQKQQADGSTRVDVRIRKAVAEAAGAGALDAVMADRYGVKRGVGR